MHDSTPASFDSETCCFASLVVEACRAKQSVGKQFESTESTVQCGIMLPRLLAALFSLNA